MFGLSNIVIKLRRSSVLSSSRSFLSEAFNLNDVWDNRLNSPTIKKVNLEALYYDLNSSFSRTRKLCPIDVDIFLNGLINDTYITEAEELVHRLRTTAETHKTLPTTHHAVIRLFLSANKVDDLMRILNDRLNYGIFPDDYCCLYMINHFLKLKDYKNAAKVSVLPMFQEDFSHPLVKQFSLYSVHNYILNPSPWVDESADEQKDANNDDGDDEEEVKIRVSYIRKPFFDDHFDLTDPNHICGKTLYMIGSTINNPIGNSYSMMGLALYNKWQKLDLHLKRMLQSDGDMLVYSESIPFIEDIINEKCTSDDLKNSITEKLKQLRVKNKPENLIITVEGELKRLIKEMETDEIEKQKKLYSEWESLRDSELEKYLIKLDKSNRLQAVESRKEELFKREQLLYYFEHEDEIELIVEKKTEKLRKRAEGEAKRKKKSTAMEDDDYIPPEVKKREASKD